MNVSILLQMDYENKRNWTIGESKPNSNPIQTQSNPITRMSKMNVNSFITKDYRKKDDFDVRINKPKTHPISEKAKMNVNLYVIKDYENKTAFRPQKNKPNLYSVFFSKLVPAKASSVPRLARISPKRGRPADKQVLFDS